MTYNEQGKRTSVENLAGQVTTTAWDGWSVTYNGENRPVLWECVSPNSSTPNSSAPPLISMSYDRMGRRVEKNDQRFVYNGYLQIANFEHQTSNTKPFQNLHILVRLRLGRHRRGKFDIIPPSVRDSF